MTHLAQLIYLIAIAMQLPNPPSGAPQGLSYLWWLILLLFLIVAGLITLLVKKGERAEVIVKERAATAESLVKLRENERDTAVLQLAQAREDLAEVESEFKTLAGINLKKLFDFWAEKEHLEADLDMARVEIRRLNNVIKRIEEGGAK